MCMTHQNQTNGHNRYDHRCYHLAHKWLLICTLYIYINNSNDSGLTWNISQTIYMHDALYDGLTATSNINRNPRVHAQFHWLFEIQIAGEISISINRNNKKYISNLMDENKKDYPYTINSRHEWHAITAIWAIPFYG